jgi:hypothetical protein
MDPNGIDNVYECIAFCAAMLVFGLVVWGAFGFPPIIINRSK